MNNFKRFRPSAICTAVAFSLALGSPAAFSQDTEEDLIEEVITTGTRKKGLSPTETMSPIDVLSGTSLSNQAAFDMTDGLTKVTPSINTQRFPIADGTAFIRPVTLRHLSPDHTLVLVNGTRRHRSPLVNLQLSPLGTVNTGSQAVDFAAIPALAIQRVEVLRDGASAQYGSDAIAGVINVILKDNNEGFAVSAQTGEYFEGDGARTSIAANGGFSLGGSGFINATLEHSTADQTSRGIQRYDCQDVIRTGLPHSHVPYGAGAWRTVFHCRYEAAADSDTRCSPADSTRRRSSIRAPYSGEAVIVPRPGARRCGPAIPRAQFSDDPLTTPTGPLLLNPASLDHRHEPRV